MIQQSERKKWVELFMAEMLGKMVGQKCLFQNDQTNSYYKF